VRHDEGEMGASGVWHNNHINLRISCSTRVLFIGGEGQATFPLKVGSGGCWKRFVREARQTALSQISCSYRIRSMSFFLITFSACRSPASKCRTEVRDFIGTWRDRQRFSAFPFEIFFVI
jgi:hypothetical protein